MRNRSMRALGRSSSYDPFPLTSGCRFQARAQRFVLRPQACAFARGQCDPHGVERGTIKLAFGKHVAEHGEAVGLLVGGVGALVGDIGGGRGAIEEEGALDPATRPRSPGGTRDEG